MQQKYTNFRILSFIMPKRKGTGIDVDRLGSWYQPSKSRKVTPVDRVTAIMAPRSSVTGAEARDKIMAKTLSKAPKVGNRIFKRIRGGSTRSHTSTSTKADTRGNRTSTITLGGPRSSGRTTINIGGKVGRHRKIRGGEITGLTDQQKQWYDLPINKGKASLKDIFFSGGSWQQYVYDANKQGITPTDENYRLFRLGKLSELNDREEAYKSRGALGNIVDAWINASPQALADAANIVGKVLPGASNITDKIEDKLGNGKHSWEELGGPVEKLINASATGAAKLAGKGLAKVNRLMPRESKIGNTRGHGVVYPVPDIKLNPDLAKLVSMVTGSSPLDMSDTKGSLSNLLHHHVNLVKNYKRQRKLPGLNPRRKITKGGRTFVSLRNILITPEAAP